MSSLPRGPIEVEERRAALRADLRRINLQIIELEKARAELERDRAEIEAELQALVGEDEDR